MDSVSRKYKDALAVLGVEDWPAVEEKLNTEDADKVLGLLVALAEATSLSSASFCAWMGITKKTHPKQKERWAAEEATNKAYLIHEHARQMADAALQIALMGEKEFIELKRMREEQEEMFERALQEDYTNAH